jgi:hypothetical protein
VYIRCFPRDNKYIKLLGTRIPHLIPTCFSLIKHFVVYSIFFLETVQTVLSGADLYYWFVAGFGDINFITPFASFFDTQIVGSMVSLSVQLFFVYRIRVLSRLCEKRSRWLCIIICLVTSSPKFQNDLFTLPAALSYRNNSSIHRWCPCEPPLSHIIEQLSIGADAHVRRIYYSRVSDNTQNSKDIWQTKWINSLLTELLCPTRSGSSQTRSLTCSLHPQ